MIKLDSFQINYFRKFKKIKSTKVGKNITVISGHNGIGKSSIMSLIASCSGTADKKISGTQFHPKFSDYFSINKDEPYKKYKIKLGYTTDKGFNFSKRLSFRNDTRSNRGIRTIPRVAKPFDNPKTTLKIAEKDAETNIPGMTSSSRVPIPTIYLSLSRLMPTGEITLNIRQLNKHNKVNKYGLIDKYKRWYSAVLDRSFDKSEKVDSEMISKSNIREKRIFVPLKDSSAATQSVGQDSIGDIIFALTEFYYLSKIKGKKYKGGMLCIDEMEASLHPAAQIKLLDLLSILSYKLKLQIFITSHSLTVMKDIIRLGYKYSSNKYKLIYFQDTKVPHPYPSSISSIYKLKADMYQETQAPKPFIRVYCEDKECKLIFNKLLQVAKWLGISVKIPRIKVIPLNLGRGNLENLPKKDRLFTRVLILVDGDAKKPRKKVNALYRIKHENEYKKIKGLGKKKFPNKCILSLPGFMSPEEYSLYILYDMSENHVESYLDFWQNTSLWTSDKVESKIVHPLLKDEEMKANGTLRNNDKVKVHHNKRLMSFMKNSNAIYYYYLKNKVRISKLKKWIELTEKKLNILKRIKESLLLHY